MEDLAKLTMLPLFGEFNVVGAVLEDDDQVNLR